MKTSSIILYHQHISIRKLYIVPKIPTQKTSRNKDLLSQQQLKHPNDQCKLKIRSALWFCWHVLMQSWVWKLLSVYLTVSCGIHWKNQYSHFEKCGYRSFFKKPEENFSSVLWSQG